MGLRWDFRHFLGGKREADCGRIEIGDRLIIIALAIAQAIATFVKTKEWDKEDVGGDFFEVRVWFEYAPFVLLEVVWIVWITEVKGERVPASS